MDQKTDYRLFYLILGIPIFIGFLFVVFWFGSYLIAKSYPEKPPMGSATEEYEERFSFASSWPFYYKYYLYQPANYNPEQKYPLVVLLHGVSRHMYGGKYIFEEAAKKYPSFVLVPIAPKNMIWAYPTRHSRREAYPLAMDAIEDVQKDFSIDPSRIYASGYSMGGYGTFGLVEHYPDVFAAALVLCGEWDFERAKFFPDDVPILAAHGSKDKPSIAREMIQALQDEGKPAEFRLYEDVGHNVWDYVYKDISMWDWLYAQRRNENH